MKIKMKTKRQPTEDGNARCLHQMKTLYDNPDDDPVGIPDDNKMSTPITTQMTLLKTATQMTTPGNNN
jgi:hypothetical protein